MNVDLQQRGVEFSQLFRTHSHLRSALLEKMPPMQLNRSLGSQQNGDSPDDNNIELIENGVDENNSSPKVAPISDSVSGRWAVFRVTYCN